MQQAYGNMWDMTADVRVITTNGFVRKDGACVMGRGCALQAKRKYPQIEYKLGRLIKEQGNNVHVLSRHIVSFPVKHKWWEKADIKLIERSARQLVELANQHPEWKIILVPRPGCGNGGLRWQHVRQTLEEILDDRFVAVHMAGVR